MTSNLGQQAARKAAAARGGQPQGGGRQQPGTAMEKAERKHALENLSAMFDKMLPAIKASLPAQMNPERMARIMYTQARYTPDLLRCSPESFAGALLTSAQFGMEPGGPTGECYLIPRKNRITKTFEVSWLLGYKGMATLFWRHPKAEHLDAQTVFSNDLFEWEYGSNAFLRHVPARGADGRPAERGEPIYWYAIGKLTGGGHRFVVLDRTDVEAHRSRSDSPNSPAWTKDYNAMGCKTAVRTMFNLLPKTQEMGRALAADGTVRTNLDEDALDAPQPPPSYDMDGETVPDDNPGDPGEPAEGDWYEEPPEDAGVDPAEMGR
jgi:recombination protein RecT